MQILGYVIGFILILAVIFIPICLVFSVANKSTTAGQHFAVSASAWNFVLFFGSVYEEKTDTRILEEEFWT